MPRQAQETQPTPPTGIVTLLFTDIAGSSQLWEQYGDHFIPVWQAHDAIIRDAIARFAGYEVKSEGDSFMAAFADPATALHCALFAQAALTRYPWPADIGPPRVRMGLHTGEPFLHGNDYFGPVVNRAAHICSAGHGGQILLSEETRRAAFVSHLDSKITFTDLGDCRLKDMGTPQRLHQAHHPSITARAFPPPRTLEGQPNNLPVQRTSFVGRAREIEAIAAYLAQGEKPVLTITGPGGIGKTRLSLQAAAAKAEWFPDGVWYVELSDAHDVVGAAVKVASTLHIPLDPALPPLPQVRDWLADRRCLLILDDANLLPQADRLIRELLSGTTNLRCLATARESLQISEAEELALSGLPTEIEPSAASAETTQMQSMEIGANAVPDRTGEPARPPALAETDAGQLFLEHALAVNPHLHLSPAETADAQALLRELEGVPVSIERAAQLMDRVPPSVVLEWLNQKLTPDRVPPRSSPGVEKFKGILRRSAQKVKATVEETARASGINLTHLLQGIANVETDRRNEEQAAELGRESLRMSQEVGDELGIAAALRQLARVKWQQGDRQSAVAMLSVAAQLYRRHDAGDYAAIQRELDQARSQLDQAEDATTAAPTLESAVKLALGDPAP
jgi:class 3 adenylate cyclase